MKDFVFQPWHLLVTTGNFTSRTVKWPWKNGLRRDFRAISAEADRTCFKTQLMTDIAALALSFGEMPRHQKYERQFGYELRCQLSLLTKRD
jgi:hypothetical protein